MDHDEKMREAKPFLSELDQIIPEDKIIFSEDEAMQRAINRWVEFYFRMWHRGSVILEKKGNQYRTFATIFRITIITASVCISTLLGFEIISREMVTIIAGALAIVAGIESYFKFAECRAEILRQQREIQAKRDELAYKWMVLMEIEHDKTKKLEAAKKLLIEGPVAYNEILNKYAFKSKEEQRDRLGWATFKS